LEKDLQFFTPYLNQQLGKNPSEHTVLFLISDGILSDYNYQFAKKRIRIHHIFKKKCLMFICIFIPGINKKSMQTIFEDLKTLVDVLKLKV